MNKFGIDIYLPCVDKNIFVQELSFSDYGNIIKFTQNKDYKNLNRYFDYILKKNSEGVNIDSLNRIDKTVILTMLRSLCVSPDLSLTFKSDKIKRDYNKKIELSNIINKLSDFDWNHKKMVNIDDNISLELTLPRSLYISDVNTIIDECFYKIIINENEFDLYDLSREEMIEFLEFLPSNIVPEIIEYIKETKNIHDDIVFFNHKDPFDENAIEHEYKFNIYDNTLFEFLMVLYTDNLKNHYQYNYILSSQCKIDTNYLQTCTPAEVNLYFKLFEEE